jgi:nicotinate-nucleotide pyrophosphorylase
VPRLTLITRVNCHLCDDARAALARIQQATGERWAEVDVDSSDDLVAEYSDRVPVVLLDGAEHGYWRVEEARLLKDLSARRPPPAPPRASPPPAGPA